MRLFPAERRLLVLNCAELVDDPTDEESDIWNLCCAVRSTIVCGGVTLGLVAGRVLCVVVGAVKGEMRITICSGNARDRFLCHLQPTHPGHSLGAF